MTSLSEVLKETLNKIPDHYEKVRSVTDTCNLDNYSLEEVTKNLNELYMISNGTHGVFNLFSGPRVLSRFNSLVSKATNLCIYKDNEVDFV